MTTSVAADVAQFFHAAFSIDIVLFTYMDRQLHILLEEKLVNEQHGLGLPGRLIDPDQETDHVMDEMMIDRIHTADFYKKQLQAFSAVNRHPAGRVITFAYYGLISKEKLSELGPLASTLTWYPSDDIPPLAFDHNEIINKVMKRFRKGLLRHPIVFELLPEEFTIADMSRIYESAFGEKFDQPNFRKKVRKSKLVVPLGKFQKSVHGTGRPGELHYYDRSAYKSKKDRVQFNF